MKRRALVGVALVLAHWPLTAQLPDVRKPFTLEDEVPVRRAIPVDKPKSTPAPPAPTPRPPGVVAAPKPMKPPEPADPGEIRISPSNTPKTGDRLQLDVADSYYARGMFDMAAPEYERYLGQYPNAADRVVAFFRLGESYRKTGSLNGARNAYETLLSLYQTGDFIGPAAFRLADMYYQERKFRDALPLYRRASVRLKDLAVVNCAKFFTGRSLEALGQKLEARLVYEDLAVIAENNPFQDASRLSYAMLLRESGRIGDALKQIDLLAGATENAELKAEATVRSGLWLGELKQPAKSEARLKEALDLPGVGRWKDLARLGLVRMLYDSGKYEEVLASYGELDTQIAPEVRPELLLFAANASRQLKKLPDALALYDRVIKDFPNSTQAVDARYERLVGFYHSDDPELVAEIDKYLVVNPELPKREQVQLMKAEVLFRKEDYLAAAPLYEALDRSRSLASTFKAEALFKLAFCYMQLRDSDRAIKAYGRFIDHYPVHKFQAYALGQRAIAYQQQKNFTAALKDYNELIARYPKAKERELALEQKALILGQQGDNAGMSEAFARLLKEYPESPATAKAHYWIGYVAFDTKSYKKAAENLAQARDLDREEFFERASLRVLLADFYLEDRAATAREVDVYKKEGKTEVPAEILRWLGEGYFKDGNFEPAEKFFEMLVPRNDVVPDDFLFLARARLKQEKFAEAAEAVQTYIKSAKEPVPHATGLIELARAEMGLKKFDGAQSAVDQALTLQPEGTLNGEARIVAGDIQMERGHFEEAAKLYVSVSLVIDEESLTPRALDKAVAAYKKAGKEAEAKKTLNTLQSRYPEFYQRNAKSP